MARKRTISRSVGAEPIANIYVTFGELSRIISHEKFGVVWLNCPEVLGVQSLGSNERYIIILLGESSKKIYLYMPLEHHHV
jgi:hypothetical protein